MGRSIQAKRTAATVCAACLLLSAFMVPGCSKKGTGFELLATASVRSPQVGYLQTPDGSALYAGDSILCLERGKLRETTRLADSYQLAARAQPQVFPMLSDQGAIQLEDGRLLLLRELRRYDSSGQPAFDRHEAVLLSMADPEAPAEILFASPFIEGGLVMAAESPPRVLAVGSPSHDATSALLISHPVGSDGDAREWTRAADGVIRTVAVSPDGTVGVIRVRSIGVMVSELTLETLRVDDGTVVSSVVLPAGEEVAAFVSYDTGDARVWLLESYTEDHTIRLATVADGAFRYLDSEVSPESHLELLGSGEILADRPGDEMVLRIIERTGESRLAVAGISEGRVELVREMENVDLVSARIVDLDGDGRNEIVGVQRVGESQVMGDGYPGRVYVVRVEEEGSYSAIHSEAYMGVGIDAIDVGDLDGDGAQEIIVGYRTGTQDLQSHVDVLSLK